MADLKTIEFLSNNKRRLRLVIEKKITITNLDSYDRYIGEFDVENKIKYKRLIASIENKDGNKYSCEIGDEKIDMILSNEYAEDIKFHLLLTKTEKKDKIENRLDVMMDRIKNDGKFVRIKIMIFDGVTNPTPLDLKTLELMDNYLKVAKNKYYTEITTNPEYIKSTRNNNKDWFNYSITNSQMSYYGPRNVEPRTSAWNVIFTIHYKLNQLLSSPLQERLKINEKFKMKSFGVEDRTNFIATERNKNPIYFHCDLADSQSYLRNGRVSSDKPLYDFYRIYMLLFELQYYEYILNGLSYKGIHAKKFVNPHREFIEYRADTCDRYKYELKLCSRLPSIYDCDILYEIITGKIIQDNELEYVWYSSKIIEGDNNQKYQIIGFKYNN